jgi:glycosyltransferase involved in cell wall biosynthesis
MAPVEAQACGRPVIAYGQGGALESIVPASGPGSQARATGVFFHEQSVRALCNAILEFERREQEFDPMFISDRAKRFDSAYFVDGFRELVNSTMAYSGQNSTLKHNGEMNRNSHRSPVTGARQRGA